MTLPRRAALDVVCLDAGNTLVGMEHELLATLLASEGIAAAPEALDRAEARARPALSRRLALGRSSEAADTAVFQVRTILTGIGVPDAEAEARAPALVRRIRTELPSRRLWTRVLPGVPEALRSLRALGLRLVVVSNSDGTVDALLADVGLRALVDGVVDSRVVGVEKPHPDIWRHALTLVDAPAYRALHVGDLHAVDVVGARAAGLYAVLLDPFGDWDDDGCPRLPDLAALAYVLAGGEAAAGPR